MYDMGLRILSVLKEMWVFKYVQSFWVSAWVMWFAWSFWVREVIIKWGTRETREHSFRSFWVYWRVLLLKSEKTRNYVCAHISAQRQSVSNGLSTWRVIIKWGTRETREHSFSSYWVCIEECFERKLEITYALVFLHRDRAYPTVLMNLSALFTPSWNPTNRVNVLMRWERRF